MKPSRAVCVCAIVSLCLMVRPVLAQEQFSDLVGPVRVESVTWKPGDVLQVPFITWGGDVATFHANGGLTTSRGTIYEEHGLKIRLTAGDDFIGQVKDYMSGKTPFLRGTFRMLAQASEVLGSDPRTKPVVVLQLSWSTGDHIVAREQLKTLNDLKPKNGNKLRIACQQGGPHVGLLYDALTLAKFNRDDIEIVWVPDLTGAQGPADRFRKDQSIDACCVITPDMLGLTGGSIGTGAEGTVRGAHTLVSTQQMTRSIADVYAVRSDWFQANQSTVEKFVAGYLKATELVLKMRDTYEDTKRMSPQYRDVLTMAQSIFGNDVLPTLEVDAHGLLLDCGFARLPGQIEFFDLEGNFNGFDAKMTTGLDLAVNWAYAKTRKDFDSAGFDYKRIARLAGLNYVAPVAAESIDATKLGDLIRPGGAVSENTIVSFEILFDPNQQEFPLKRYGSDFRRAIQSASTFGGAVVVIRGHSDPTLTLVNLLKAGVKKNMLRQVGSKWYFNGKPLDLSQTDNIVSLVKSGQIIDEEFNPLQTMQAALNLSLDRAKRVKNIIIALAEREGIILDTTQLQPVGVGITEPVVPVPTSEEEAAPNRRVEFRIVKVPSEATKKSDFDLLSGNQ